MEIFIYSIKLGSLLLFISCNMSAPAQNDRVKRDTLRRDIPLNSRGELISTFYSVQETGQSLHMNSLLSGTEGLEIRIWYSYSRNDTLQVLVLRNSTDTLRSEFITAIYTKGSNKLVKKSNVYPVSKLKRNVFLNRLFELGIMTLPDMDHIPGRDWLGVAHGDSFSVEIGTDSLYRFYQYVEPYSFSSEVPEAAKMVEILNLLKYNFELDLLERE